MSVIARFAPALLCVCLLACQPDAADSDTASAARTGDPLPSAAASGQSLSTQQSILVSLIARHHFAKPSPAALRERLDRGESVHSLLASLDPYSRLLDAEQAGLRRRRAELQRVGAGLDILFDGPQAYAVAVPGTPFADAVGSGTATALQQLDKQPVSGTDISSFRPLVSHRAGETLSVGLGDGRTLSLPVVRYPNAALYFEQDDDGAMIRIRQFRSGQTRELAAYLRQAMRGSALVLDLRFSPGGDLFAMTDWLSLFLPPGLEIGRVLSAQGERRLHTLPGQIAGLPPLTVLIGGFTASSAEIFARVLKQHRPGTRLVGGPTRGKCLVQRNFALPGGAELQLSTGEFVIGNQSCQGRPLWPD
ncbi:S41 family peptidase [Granulosicoccaceae sp. 1_MG-2023]|nr:S41 family peptidase [Granulosicoccaceae sp. 1_MG-2023]